MSVEWTSCEPRNVLSKGNYSPRICCRPPVLVGFGNFFILDTRAGRLHQLAAMSTFHLLVGSLLVRWSPRALRWRWILLPMDLPTTSRAWHPSPRLGMQQLLHKGTSKLQFLQALMQARPRATSYHQLLQVRLLVDGIGPASSQVSLSVLSSRWVSHQRNFMPTWREDTVGSVGALRKTGRGPPRNPMVTLSHMPSANCYQKTPKSTVMELPFAIVCFASRG